MTQPTKRKSDSRWEQYNCLIDTGLADLAPSEQLVLLVAFRYGRGMGFFRVPVSQVVKLTGLTKKTVRTAFDRLEEKGLIQLHREASGRRTREYRIQFDKAGNGVVLKRRKNEPP